MAFPPNQTSARGDVYSLSRLAWADNSSALVALQSGKLYAPTWGKADYNYDDAEGWAPRINYHGTYDQKPWNGIGGGTGTIDHTSKSSMANLRRKNNGGVGSTTGTSAYILKLQNQDGAYGNEVYTSNYTGVGFDYVVCGTDENTTWYTSWYARKSGNNSSDTVRMTLYVFGVGYDGSVFNYTITGASIGNASSGTTSSPATGHTSYYIGKKTLTTSWTKYEACFTFNGNANIGAVTMRWDVDDGVSGGTTTVYIDRPILYPVNLKASKAIGGSAPEEFSSSDTGSYAT